MNGDPDPASSHGGHATPDESSAGGAHPSPHHGHGAASVGENTATKDPVCGMTVSSTSPHRLERAGVQYLFCSPGCRAKFAADPENRWLWRMPRRRLEIEAWRDAMLLTAGIGQHQPVALVAPQLKLHGGPPRPLGHLAPGPLRPGTRIVMNLRCASRPA